MCSCKSVLGLVVVVLSVLQSSILPVSSAVLNNPDFEIGSVAGWSTTVNQMSVTARTNETFNRNFAAAITGVYKSATWITNSISQSFNVIRGDDISVEGFLFWKSYTEQAAAGTGYVQAIIKGDFNVTQSTVRAVWTATNSWSYFKLANLTFGTLNSGFELPGLTNWAVGCDHLTAYDFTPAAASGGHSMRMVGSFTNWSWNQAYQLMQVRAGDVVRAKAKMRVDALNTSGDWLVAGIKLEKDGGGQNMESTKAAPYNTTSQWVDLTFTMTCTQSGSYVYRTMVAGGNNGTSQADVYFDDVSITTTGTTQAVTLELAYVANSGGATVTSTASIFLDALTMKGSRAGIVPATNILTLLRSEAQTIGTNASALIPPVVFPALFSSGSPVTGQFPSVVEAAIAGWKFKYLTNNVSLTCTNTILCSALGASGPGYIEFDQYAYCAKNPHKERGLPLDILTNSPYFTLGTKNGSSAEFGNGPFGATHTYVVGTSLTNFPKRMSTDGSGGWPSILNIVFQENISKFTNSLWNKHFIITSIPTNASGIKAVKIGLNVSKSGGSNDLEALTQEIHMGWATEAQCYGLVDYPNITYQDHNEVALRAPWINNLVDDGTGWYIQQSPRGSATIEPIELYALNSSNWVQRMYDEVLFTWSHAASGVRSLFDDDSKSRLKGQVAYHVGFKIGHSYGTNDIGESNYPEVLNIRGNGYFRMADYDGVMAGSFRPMASDQYGLYKGYEDYPLIPKAYSRIVPRTTATNQPDNSYGQLFASIRSNTNQFFTGCVQMDLHFAPDEVATNGCYFDLGAEVWAHKANIVTQHGPYSLFTQVSMYWRGGSNINDGAEGHDVDAVMVKKADGEWVTHQILNPPTNVVHRTLSTFKSNDVVYLMQQDRGRDSYGFATEAPYKRASAFEITMLNDGGLPLNLDIYEQNTFSEIADNIDIACNVRSNLTQGQKFAYKYRYRTIYAPGVYIINPNESSGAENWSNNSYRIEFYATDGHDETLKASIYYGNGKDSDWRLINTNVTLYVPTNTHRVSYDWNTANVATGAYYIKVTAQRISGGKVGFDVSNTRIQAGRAIGFLGNGTVQNTVTTNTADLGTNNDFEAGSTAGWVAAADHLSISVQTNTAYQGSYAARMSGSWSGWSWNNLRQDMTCKAGEVLHVTGKVRINSLVKGGADWVGCGVKMESGDGSSSTEQSFNESSPTGSWLTVDFYRTTVSTTDRIVLWVAGNDCTSANVFFDDLKVVSTNGPVVTNSVRAGYWMGSSAINVTNLNVLSFFVSGTNSVSGARVWVSDSSGVTNSVLLTNYIDRLASIDQRVDVPWTHFATVNKGQIRAIGFTSTNVLASRMRAVNVPLMVRSKIGPAPQADGEGIPCYFPGQIMTNVITLTNMTSVAQTGVTVQIVQEYGETRFWLDTSPGVANRISEKTRRGDRLCDGFEQIWTNRTIPANGVLRLTNTYVNPAGKLVNYGGSNAVPWYAFRNYQSRAQVHVVVRRINGDNVYDNDGAGCYGVDDDSTMTNNTLLSKSTAFSPVRSVALGTSTKSLAKTPSETVSVSTAASYSGMGIGSNVYPVPSAAIKPVRPSFGLRTRGLPFHEDFNDGNSMGWALYANPGVKWSVGKSGVLQANIVGGAGYAYMLVNGLTFTNRDVSIEYDVRFADGAAEGGVIFQGRVLYVSPVVCGWDDSTPQFVVGCPVLTQSEWHHVAIDIRDAKPCPLSDLFIDGIPIFFDEPVERPIPGGGVGLLSPYYGGSVNWDNIEIYMP